MALSKRSTTRAEQIVRLQVERWLHQTWVAPVQKVGADQLQSTHRLVHERPDDGLGGRISGQRVEIALEDGGGRFCTHETQTRRFYRGLNVHPPRFSWWWWCAC